jgi:hypothetical protein
MDFMSGDRRVRAFRATDAFAVEAYRLFSKRDGGTPSGVLEAIRLVALRSGGALVAAASNPAGGGDERRLLTRARVELSEGRYYLYLARRLGLINARRYRGLTVRHDAALRELDLLLERPAAGPEPVPP